MAAARLAAMAAAARFPRLAPALPKSAVFGPATAAAASAMLSASLYLWAETTEARGKKHSHQGHRMGIKDFDTLAALEDARDGHELLFSGEEDHVPYSPAGRGNNFMWDTLQGKGCVERSRVWSCKSDSTAAELGTDEVPGQTCIRALLQLGNRVSGHPNLVHGGMLAAMLDDLYAWAVIQEKAKQEIDPRSRIFTAKLTTNFRRPAPTEACLVVECRVTRIAKGKKVYLEGAIYDSAGSVLVDSHCLYIIKPVVASKA